MLTCISRRRGLAIVVAALLSVAFAVTRPVLAGAPANDDCTDATTIALGQFPFTTEEATSAGPGVCVAFGKDVWFKHRARFTGNLLVSLCDNANFDTVLTVYRGSGCSNSTLIANQLACNDDGQGCSDNTSELTVAVTNDQVYLIRIGGFLADSGTGVLTLECADQEAAACASIIKTGAAEDDRLGYAIAEGGLKNADNFADVLVGAYRNDTAGSNAGRAVAYRGATLANLYVNDGEAAGDNFGFSVATGDINDDGRADLIIGAPLNDEAAANSGKVYVFNGFTGALLWDQVGQTAGDRFGYAVAFAGDVDDDGFGDVVVGAPFYDSNLHGGATSIGRAYILDGEDGDRLRTHTGQAAGDQFGSAVAGVDDINDDGNADYIIGAPRNDTVANDAGRATIYNGDTGAVLFRLDGTDAGERFGTALAARRFTSVADYTHIVVGSPFNDFGGSNAGRARVFFRNHDNPGELGCAQLVCLRFTINGSAVNGRLGSAVALGDLLGNSAADTIVGAPFTDFGGNSTGAAFVFDGNTGGLSRRFFGEAPGDRFATAVAFANDIDDDGENDVVIGGPFNNAGGSNAGRAYAFLLGQSAALTDWTGKSPEINPTVERAGAIVPGDVTRDGLVNADDLIAVIAAWGPCAAPQPCAADLNHDQQVNVEDLLAVISAW